jgi:hypothetical protein
MKFQFNLFGLEIQVTRLKRFGVVCWYKEGDVHMPLCFDFTTYTKLGAWFAGWRTARQMAEISKDSTMFCIFRINESYPPNQLPEVVRVISVRKQVEFFSK